MPLMCVNSLQSCPTVSSPMNGSLPGSSVHGVLQVRLLEWTAMSSSRGSSRPWAGSWLFHVSCVGRQLLHHQNHLGSTYAPKKAILSL